MAAATPQGSSGTPISSQSRCRLIRASKWCSLIMGRFNIYIYDYCYKRGFRKTAKELMLEAEIPAESMPPINAKQGLLFECMVECFWVLFQAKSNGGGSDDGLLYIQAQQQRGNQRQAPPQPPPAVAPGQIPSNAMSHGPHGNPALQPSQLHPQQAAVGPAGQPPQGPPRVNGLPSVMPRPPYMTNGAMPNGVGGMGMPSQQQPGVPSQMGFGGMGGNGVSSQANGVQGGTPQQSIQQGPQGGPGGQGPPMHFSMVNNGRAMMNGMQPQQQRGPPNGAGPFHSPTMTAPSPGQQQQQQQGNQAPMAHLGPGPSPHLSAMPMNRGGMPPPLPTTNGGQPGQATGGPPTPGYPGQGGQTSGGPAQQTGRPPSRTNTPRNAMMHPSPSLAARQTPNPMMGNNSNPNMGTPGLSMSSENSLNTEIMQIQQNSLNDLKQQLGIGDKDMSALSMDDKNRILNLWRTRASQASKMSQGPAGMMSQPPRPPTGGPSGPAGLPRQQQQGMKRSSNSPAEDEQARNSNESSPPANKRLRRSPENPATMGPYTQPPNQIQPGQMAPQSGQHGMSGPHQPPGQPGMSGVSNTQHQINAMLMMQRQQQQQMPMGSLGMNISAGLPQQQQQSQPGPPGQPRMMNMGATGGMHGSGPMMNPQQQMHNRYSMQKPGMGQNPTGQPPEQHAFNPGMPPPLSGPQFNSSPLNRLNAKPMMPPPSPNGPPKDVKQEAGPTKIPGGPILDGSPRGMPTQPPAPGGAGTPSGSGTAPPTPVPSHQPNPLQQQQGGQPQQQPPQQPGQPQQQNSNGMTGMNLLSGLGGEIMFDNPFAINMNTMEEFDPTGLFRPDGDINFERDFGQWFNPDDGSMPDMK